MEERDTQKPRGFVVWKLSDVGAVRRRVSDSRDTSESSSRPGDAIATRPRRIRARSSVSGARACPAKCVPPPPPWALHIRERASKRKRAKEVSHRVSGSQTRKSDWTQHCESDTRKKESRRPISTAGRQGRPGLFAKGRHNTDGFFQSVGHSSIPDREDQPQKSSPDALFRTRAARTCRRLCTVPDTSRSAKTRFVQRTAKGSDGGGVPPRSRRRQGGIG